MKTSMFAKWALVAATAMVCSLPPLSSAAEKPRSLIPANDILRDFWYIDARIKDGNNELRNAIDRFDKAYLDKSYYPLCEQNVVLSYVRLDQARHRLERLPTRIENVEGTFLKSASMWRKQFDEMSTTNKNNSYKLENDLQNFVPKLSKFHTCRLLNAYKAYRDSIWNKETEDFDKTMESVITVIRGGGDNISFPPTAENDQQIRDAVQNKNIPELVRLYNMFPNDQRLQEGLYSALTSGPNPMSPEDARAALEAFKKGDAKALQALLAKYPNNQALRAMAEKLGASATSGSPGGAGGPGGPAPATDVAAQVATALGNRDAGALAAILAQHPGSQEARDAMVKLLTSAPTDPMSEQDAQAAAAAIASGDKETIKRLLQKYPNNQALRDAARRMGIDVDAIARGPGGPSNTGGPGGPGGPATPSTPPPPPNPKDIDSTIVVDPDWAPPVWDPVKNEYVMGPNVSRTYMGRKGGRLTQEQEVTATWRRGETKPQISYGKKSAWSIQVEKGGPGYQIVNMSMDGGEITVESWTVTGQGGNVVKSGTGTDIAVDFPASGRYTIKATGKTKPGNSPFEIEQPVDVQK